MEHECKSKVVCKVKVPRTIRISIVNKLDSNYVLHFFLKRQGNLKLTQVKVKFLDLFSISYEFLKNILRVSQMMSRLLFEWWV